MGIFIEPKSLPDSADGFIQLLFLLVVYGYILKNASHMISEGSELLLLVPSLAGVVGSVVLPVLGAVPDGAIVVFSGTAHKHSKPRSGFSYMSCVMYLFFSSFSSLSL